MARDAVAEVRDRTDMVGLVTGYVQLKKAGRNFKGLCPFHQEKTPSFIVFPESGTFHCFGCGKGGDALTFYKEVERVDFREALQELAKRAGVELQSAPPPSPERDAHRSRLIEINEVAATFFASQLRTGEAGEAGRRLVEQRGLTPNAVQDFQLGFAPEAWDKLAQFLAARGIDPQLAMDVGLLSERQTGGYYDRFRNRLIFPIRDREGLVVGFGARAIGDDQPKYLNSPQTEIFDKSQILYGLDKARDAIRKADQVVIVEGYMDVIAAHEFGYKNVVASMGTAVTESQLGLLKRFTKNIVLALDADNAGQMAMVRALEALPDSETESTPVPRGDNLVRFEKRLSVNISVLEIPNGKDPDELIRNEPDSWPGVVNTAQPFIRFYIDRVASQTDLADPRAKESSLQRAAALLSLLPDGVEARHYVDLLATRLRIPDRAVILEAIRVARRGHTAAAQTRPVLAARQANATEDHLMAVILNYPTVLAGLASEIVPDELVDARNRELLADLVRTQFADESVAPEPTEPNFHVEEQRQRLVGLIAGRAVMNRLEVMTEATRTLEKLRRDRNEHLIEELQMDIAAAETDNDTETVQTLLDAMEELTTEHIQLYPRKSPVFRDTRDPIRKSKGKIKLLENLPPG